MHRPFDPPHRAEIAADVAAGRRSAPSMSPAWCLARVAAYEAVQPQVWIERVPAADVLAQARGVDPRIAAGEILPLAGVPFAVKDNIDVAGLPTTAACPAFAYTPRESARRRRSGCWRPGRVLIGKTNLDQFATGLVGARSPYGALRLRSITATISAAAPAPARRWRWPPGWWPSRWAPTRPAPAGCRRRSTTWWG